LIDYSKTTVGDQVRMLWWMAVRVCVVRVREWKTRT